MKMQDQAVRSSLFITIAVLLLFRCGTCQAFVIVTVLFSLFSAYVAITRTVVAEKSFLALFAIASLASAWANLPIGPRIGWNRGGLPVVLVVFFVALVAYCFVALIAGGILYGIISTSTAYPPNQW